MRSKHFNLFFLNSAFSADAAIVFTEIYIAYYNMVTTPISTLISPHFPHLFSAMIEVLSPHSYLVIRDPPPCRIFINFNQAFFWTKNHPRVGCFCFCPPKAGTGSQKLLQVFGWFFVATNMCQPQMWFQTNKKHQRM